MPTLTADHAEDEPSAGEPPGGSHGNDKEGGTVFAVLAAVAFAHFLNDSIQSLLPALYPLFKTNFALSFTQVGFITLTFQLTSSLLQPLIGIYSDRKPMPFLLPAGLGATLVGLLLLAGAHGYPMILVSAGLVGMGSAVFHPEASRMAHLASGGRHGFAQSFFQLGGNTGTSLGPLLAVLIVRQPHIAWFSLVALLAIVVLSRVGRWYGRELARLQLRGRSNAQEAVHGISRRRVYGAIGILMALIFSKYFYIASLLSFYTFYLMQKFHLSVQEAQIHLFVLMFSIAAGTLIGGPVGDRYGRKVVIWVSILGTAPFSLLLPHASLFWTGVLSVCIGVILSSAFSAILVYAQTLIPGKVGMVAGLFFGFAFGMGGIGSALLGKLADMTSIDTVFRLCAYLPLIGLLTVFLPSVERRVPAGARAAE